MLYAGIAVIVVIIAISFIYSYKRSQKISQNGIEVDAVVSRMEEKETEDADGNRDVTYDYFVRYQNQAGETMEAKLGNPPRFIREGDHLRVKYLPEKPKYALMIKK